MRMLGSPGATVGWMRQACCILLLLECWWCSYVIVQAVDVTTDPMQTLPEGRFQAHYSVASSSTHNMCETVVFISVGTAMKVQDYEALGTSIVQEATNARSANNQQGSSMVAIIIDSNPWWIQKQDGKKYTKLVNAIASRISDLVPACQAQPPNRYLIGGHSGGGQGAVEALQSLHQFNFTPAGFVGLAPYQISSSISIPSLNIGFSRMSCWVNPQQAALAAYTQTTDTNHRVFYQFQTNNTNTMKDGPHCSFADAGCFGPLEWCKGEGNMSTWMHDFVGQAIHAFNTALNAVHQPFDRQHFQNVADQSPYSISLFVNDDDPLAIRTKNLFEVAPSTPVWPLQWSANFSVEYWGNLGWKRSTNTGRYAYDWTGGQSLERHGKRQKDNWYGCAPSSSDDCRILAYTANHPHSYQGRAATYAHVGDVCCMLFVDVGPLAPTWLESSPAIRYNGPKTAGVPPRSCNAWENTKPGNKAFMVGYLWLIDNDGVPCGYKDVFKWWARLLGLGHYFTFDSATYELSAKDGDFDLPPDCQKVCPNKDDKSKPWCKDTWAG